MSIKNWPGGRISPTPPTPTGPFQDSTASGVWTLDQVAYWEQQNQWPTAGNVDPSAFIENLFSTWLYTGNGSTQTITNGIDLSGKGGLVWMKSRNVATDNALYDTARGATFDIASNLLDTQTTQSTGLTSFGSNGFSIGSLAKINTSSNTYVSWTFRKQPKFFDVVTYTGNGVGGRTVAHNLGSVPGCIIVKRLDGAIANWAVYHRSLGNTERLFLNSTFSQSTDSSYWNNTTPSSTVFTVGTNGNVNESGATYVAYLFAHNAGGFGLTGTDNVISCGSWVGDGSVEEINLGWEPQFILYKAAGASQDWFIRDNMRGWGVDISATSAPTLRPNTSGAETSSGGPVITPTGFRTSIGVAPGYNYIYIAIRRGPMKTPTSGTDVFQLRSGPINVAFGTTPGLPYAYSGPDLLLSKFVSNPSTSAFVDRLRGVLPTNASTNVPVLRAESTGAEVSTTSNAYRTVSNSVTLFTQGSTTQAAIGYFFRRAPGFFDVVCYTGDGTSGQNINHNLGVAPELMIVKTRSTSGGWAVYAAPLGNSTYLRLNTTDSTTFAASIWNATTPTSSTFRVGGLTTAITTNVSGINYVAYLFATLAGVSKVGSYTGTGSTLQIDCGFTGGARFVLIKRTDNTGDWYVWDSARGIVSGNDPYLLLNSTAAEVTNTDWVDTHSPGFELSNAAGNLVNTNGASYIFLAIA